MIIMGRLTRGLGGQAGTHDDYYTINPRRVSGMVEKSKKKPFCDAKFDKKRVFLGDRVLEPQRERSIINDLRAPQATQPRHSEDALTCKERYPLVRASRHLNVCLWPKGRILRMPDV
jgi:hypothetical protein